MGPTAESFQALHSPPGVIGRCPGPGHYARAFRLCIHRPAASPDPLQSVLGSAPSLFLAASGQTGQLKANQLPRQPGSHRGPQQDHRTPAPPIELQAPTLSPVADAAAATAQPTKEAKLVKPDCSCSPGAQAASAQPFQPAASSDVQPTVMPDLPLRPSPWWPLSGIGSEGSVGRVRTSYPGCIKHPKCKRAQHL